MIIPARSGAEPLRACLDGIASSHRRPDQVIVIDDASPQPLTELVRSYGYEAIRHAGPPRGPAVSRNRAAAGATGDVLAMVDADVVLHPDALGRIEQQLAGDPELAAVFGSYDDRPAAATIISRYRNLLHHHTHHQSAGEARTFWAGCGAIRKSAFDAVGGFSERFTRPSIEDIELGRRLCRAGMRIRLCPEIQGTHLKRWTLPGMIRTDIFARAVPWTRLMLREGRAARELNLGYRQRISAVLAWLTVILGAVGFAAPWAWSGTAAALAAWVFLNRRFFGLLIRRGGVRLAVGGAALHLLYYLYASAAFAAVTLGFHIRRRAVAIALVVVLLPAAAWGLIGHR